MYHLTEDSMTAGSIGRSITRPVKTCTECKQVKLRCDSKVKFPAPCSRCQARRLHCIVDSQFRRTPARKRVEEMQRELEALKSQQSDSKASRTTESPSMPEASLTSSENTAESSDTPLFDWAIVDTENFELGSVILEKATTLDIYQM
ncbi:hypothetical protein K491DRAFT_484823 [Lophiostoma macrostomum CBS 122681]|uniref:Zn(2)-C6 fungal-type domain-containing protein n=1 Tax=Lophiostoma macrostomum CBS 122681 TaxID=1314788 RepID=A0A6A6T4M4_9PLEO|nr:hypothetical protein K491DRAFT_484823 [Lophiostoma macrostomum CBS 122681]